ncbi:MAG TPA: Hsp70 family protein, partial [Planctomycetaceae bacterium]|nr:Hsp70 family protein [Planctomycetaceae bacterium]
PDQSIAHGATYYAGMLLTNSKFARSILSEQASARLRQVRQRSINARALGILIRDMDTKQRVPYYLIPDHTPLPAAKTQNFGTVIPNQHRVHLQIIESGTSPEQPHVKIGECVVDRLPPNLPEGSEIAVTIRYDEQARIHVDARDVTSGARASTEIIRQENVVQQLQSDAPGETDAAIVPAARRAAVTSVREEPPPPTAARPARVPDRVNPTAARPQAARSPAPRPVPQPRPAPQPQAVPRPREPVVAAPKPALEAANEPVPLCNRCGEPLNAKGICPSCGTGPASERAPAPEKQPRRIANATAPRRGPARPATAGPPKKGGAAADRPGAKPLAVPAPPSDDEILELDDSAIERPVSNPPGGQRGGSPPGAGGPAPRRQPSPRSAPRPRPAGPRPAAEGGEDEFWQLAE